MPVPYRLAALLSTLSLATAFLVASGFVCSSADAASPMADMPGMDMSSMIAQQPADGGSAHAPGGASETVPPPCEFPWAPSGCVSMAPCAPAGIAVERVSPAALSPEVLDVASASPLQPPSETIAPELPPPRA